MSNSYQITGTVDKVGESEQKSATFAVRELRVRTEEDTKYPQLLAIQFANDKGAMLDGLNPGDGVTVNVNLRGREWNDRVFVNLDGWKIDKTGSGQAPSAAPAGGADFDDDVPF